MSVVKGHANSTSQHERKRDIMLMCACMLIFLLPSLLKILTQDFPIEELVVGIDDWNRYARHALDIKQNGLLIENVQGEYLVPAGFLYNYFVAGIFVLFGDFPAVVYVIQSLLLGASVAMTYFVFRDKIKPKTGYILLILLILFAFIDIYKNYTFRLFSENLAIFTITLFLYFSKRALTDSALRWQLLVGLTLGASVLIRPNILPFGLAFILIFHLPGIIRRVNFIKTATFLFGFVMILMLLPLRNLMAFGHAVMMPIDGTFVDYMERVNPISLSEDPIAYFLVYLRKILYCLGDIPILNPDFRLRPHWFFMWGGFILFQINVLRHPRQRDNFSLLAVLYVISFYLTLILIAKLEVYGHRMFIPALPAVLCIGVIGYERTWMLIKEKVST